jgi:LytR cell envelope-related transcriptional attenuator
MTEMPEGPDTGQQRRTTRAGEGGAPVSGALTIVLAVIAVVAGFLILRAISDDDGDGASSPGVGTAATTPPAGSTPLDTTTTTTTTPPLVTTGAQVQVANASNVNGAAAGMSRALEAVGYTMGEPTNRSEAFGQAETTVIYYNTANPQALAVAESVSRSLGGVTSISELTVPAPTQTGEADGDVLVMLGIDKAGKTLEELNPTSTAVTPGVTSPAVSGTAPAATTG